MQMNEKEKGDKKTRTTLPSILKMKKQFKVPLIVKENHTEDRSKRHLKMSA